MSAPRSGRRSEGLTARLRSWFSPTGTIRVASPVSIRFARRIPADVLSLRDTAAPPPAAELPHGNYRSLEFHHHARRRAPSTAEVSYLFQDQPGGSLLL